MSAPKRETVIADNVKYTRGADDCQASSLNFSTQATVRRAQPIVSQCIDSLPQQLVLIKCRVIPIIVHLNSISISDEPVVSDIRKYTTCIQNDRGIGTSGLTSSDQRTCRPLPVMRLQSGATKNECHGPKPLFTRRWCTRLYSFALAHGRVVYDRTKYTMLLRIRGWNLGCGKCA